jgi:hypothetical protein
MRAGDLARTPDNLAKVIHNLTVGHPGTSKLLMDAVQALPDDEAANLDLRTILELELAHPGLPPERVGDTARNRMLKGAQETRLATTCAAAQDLEAVARLEDARIIGSRSNLTLLCRRLDADTWAPATGAPSSAATGSPISHTLLRRLLLWDLARRPESDPDNWTTVHRRLRAHYRTPEGAIRALYHTLALGELDQVAERFDKDFGEEHIGQWLTDLNFVTRAPNRLHTQPVSASPPLEQVSSLTLQAARGNERGKVIARLVTAMWILADPLTTPRRELRSLICRELLYLADRAGQNWKLLHDEAQKYCLKDEDDSGM